MTPLRFLKMKTIVKNFFLHSTLFILCYVSLSKKDLTLPFHFSTSYLRSTKLDLLHLCIKKPPLPANTYTGIFLILSGPMKPKINLVATLVYPALSICSSSRLHAELDKIRSILVANGYPNHIITSTFFKKIRQFNQSSQRGPKKCPVYLRLPWLGNVSTKFGKQITIQPFSVATLLLKQVLFFLPGLFFPQPRRMYYLPITTIMLSINLCATAIVGT